LDKTNLLENYAANLSDGSRAHYTSYAKDFLDFADTLDKESIIRYLAKLKRQKKSAGTINFVFRVIRTLFNVNKLDWPFRRGEAPQIRQRDEYKPALDPELIKVMVAAAKDGKLGIAPACFLALSTTYGLRREEMCDLVTDDVDLKHKQSTIFISTVKSGRERYHLIPAEIKPFVESHDFSQRYNLTQMSQLFWVVANRSGLEALRPQRLGWHSIRRSVLRSLYDAGLNPQSIHYFMRWRGGGNPGLAMDERYYATTVIGLEGGTAITQEADPDKEIFEKHPLLEFWR